MLSSSTFVWISIADCFMFLIAIVLLSVYVSFIICSLLTQVEVPSGSDL